MRFNQIEAGDATDAIIYLKHTAANEKSNSQSQVDGSEHHEEEEHDAAPDAYAKRQRARVRSLIGRQSAGWLLAGPAAVLRALAQE